jgi:tetratricopeptide (TPR) repeat protein
MAPDQTVPTYESAEALRRQGNYQMAAQSFEQLWQKSPSPSVGWRWAFSLRKLGSLDKAEQTIREVLKKYSDDKFVVSEFGWILYYREVKPGMDENNLGRVLHAANEIWQYKPTELLLAKLIMAVTKAAGKRDKWDVVLEWSGRVQPGQLDIRANEFEGKQGMSDREVWYIRRSRALLELGQYEEARRVAQAGLTEFPNELYLARTAALALAGAGDITGGVNELRPLLHHPRADAYLKADLGELEFKLGNLEEAHRLLCEAVLKPQGDQYKLGYFLTMAEIALAKQKPVSAAESLALAKAVRQKEEWSIPTKLTHLEQETRQMLEAQGQSWPELPKDLKSLSRICVERWRAESVVGLKRVTGKVGRITPDKKYTFIHRDNGEKPVFVLLRDLPQGISEGMKVDFALKPSFDRKKNEESFQATDVRIVK